MNIPVVSMKKTIYTLAIIGLLFACQSKQQTEQSNNTEAVVMALHDSTMIHMDELMAMKDSLNLVAKKDSTLRPTTDSLGLALTMADEAMTDWMNGYEMDYKTKHTPEETQKYYEAELLKIKEVQQKMNASIANAKAFLK